MMLYWKFESAGFDNKNFRQYPKVLVWGMLCSPLWTSPWLVCEWTVLAKIQIMEARCYPFQWRLWDEDPCTCLFKDIVTSHLLFFLAWVALVVRYSVDKIKCGFWQKDGVSLHNNQVKEPPVISPNLSICLIQCNKCGTFFTAPPTMGTAGNQDLLLKRPVL